MNETSPTRRPIRLVVSDIDGTLVNRAKVLTPRARRALEGLKRAGVHFSVASARPPAGLRRIVDMLGLEVPVGAVNGAAIIRPDLSVISELFVPVDAARTTVALLGQQGLDPWLFTRDKWFFRVREGAHVEHEATTIGLEPIVVEEFAEADLAQTLKIVAASHDHPLLAECESILQASLSGAALATRSQAYYLDVTNAHANKGEAVKGIAAHLGVALAHVMTIGDGANDTPMFEVSGFSVAMGNGTEAVRRCARAVTDTCEDEGFAKAIERYVLGMTAEASRDAALEGVGP